MPSIKRVLSMGDIANMRNDDNDSGGSSTQPRRQCKKSKKVLRTWIICLAQSLTHPRSQRSLLSVPPQIHHLQLGSQICISASRSYFQWYAHSRKQLTLIRLDHLQLQSLERRRLIADLVLTYRIISGLIDLNMSDYFTLQSSSGYSATTRGNPYKLFVNHCRINVRKKIFSERIIRVWNSLPPSIVSFESLSSFRNSLGNVNLGIYTKY